MSQNRIPKNIMWCTHKMPARKSKKSNPKRNVASKSQKVSKKKSQKKSRKKSQKKSKKSGSKRTLSVGARNWLNAVKQANKELNKPGDPYKAAPKKDTPLYKRAKKIHAEM